MVEPNEGPSDDDATYESLLETSPAPINLFDASGTTVWGNDAVSGERSRVT